MIDIIHSRRSIRRFTAEPVSDDTIRLILDAGIWAPSGLNNQPWMFSIIKDAPVKKNISQYTKYSRIIRDANCCIAVFYNLSVGYSRDKDIMSIGACIQNMLLAAASLGIGTVWLGEILARKDEVRGILGINEEYELMAVVALGYPDEKSESDRKSLDEFILQ
jgi:nitroreductase